MLQLQDRFLLSLTCLGFTIMHLILYNGKFIYIIYYPSAPSQPCRCDEEVDVLHEEPENILKANDYFYESTMITCLN